MKSIFFLLLLAGNASAEWVQIGSAKDAEFDHFVKVESIKRDGGIRNALVLFNYKDETSEVKSRVALKEYDCNLKKNRTNYLITYSGHMATGEVISFSSPSKNYENWKDTDPLTVAYAVMKFVCSSESELPILKS